MSSLSALWTISTGGVLILFGWWIIPFIYGQDYALAYPSLAILLVGYGFANILQWNRPLLLALGLPTYPLRVAVCVGLVKTGFTLGLLPKLGYLAESVILSAYFLVSVTLNVRHGVKEINHRSTSEQTASHVRDGQSEQTGQEQQG